MHKELKGYKNNLVGEDKYFRELNSSYMLDIIMNDKQKIVCNYYGAIEKIINNCDKELEQLYKELSDTRNIRVIRYIDSGNRLKLVYLIECFVEIGSTFKNSVLSTNVKKCKEILTLKDSKTNTKSKYNDILLVYGELKKIGFSESKILDLLKCVYENGFQKAIKIVMV